MLRRTFLIHGSTALAGTMFTRFANAAADPGKPVYGGTLTIAFASDTKTLDPTYSVNFSERQPLYLIYNTLLAIQPDASIGPELAEKWEVLDEGKRIVLHLRQGVKFHDGTPFDAQAVKFNLDQRLDPAVQSPLRPQLSLILDKVDVTDPATVTLHLKATSPALLGMLAQREGFMSSPTAVKKYGKDYGTNPVGTGPFVFRQWTPGSTLVVEKNPQYWEQGKPYLDRVVFSDTSSVVVGMQRLITGEADYLSALSPTDVRQLQNRSNIRLDEGPPSRWYGLQWQVDRAPFNNPALRQAIAHAIDRKRIVDILMAGKATIAESLTPPGLWWFDPKLKSYPYDPAKAKELLAQANLPNLTLSLSNPQITLLQQINQLVQEQLRAVGITVKLDPIAQSDWYPRLSQGLINFSPIRWSQRPDPDGLYPLLLRSTGAQNSTKYNNPQVDKLLDEARDITDLTQRQQLYWQAQEIVARDLPYVPLFFSIEYAAMRSNVHNHVWIPDDIPRFRDVWKSAG
jgi:peptide/nickel transport system substrate-binding protein